jgi:hypothetical protein
MKEILRSQWDYMLCEKDRKLVFSVICGSVAIYEINIFLNEEEIRNYETIGEEFLKELATHVRNKPELFKLRNLKIDIT